MNESLIAILKQVGKPGIKTTEGKATATVLGLAIIGVIGGIFKFNQDAASDQPGFMLIISLLSALFASKWYGQQRANIKGALGEFLNNPLLGDILQELKTPPAKFEIPGALPQPPQREPIRPVGFMEAATGIPAPVPTIEKPSKIEILRNGETEVQTFDTRLEACEAANALRTETPGLKVHVL